MDAYRIVVKVRKEDILYISGLFESYSRLAATRTIDRALALMEILASPFFVEEVHALIKALGKEIMIEIISECPPA